MAHSCRLRLPGNLVRQTTILQFLGMAGTTLPVGVPPDRPRRRAARLLQTHSAKLPLSTTQSPQRLRGRLMGPSAKIIFPITLSSLRCTHRQAARLCAVRCTGILPLALLLRTCNLGARMPAQILLIVMPNSAHSLDQRREVKVSHAPLSVVTITG